MYFYAHIYRVYVTRLGYWIHGVCIVRECTKLMHSVYACVCVCMKTKERDECDEKKNNIVLHSILLLLFIFRQSCFIYEEPVIPPVTPVLAIRAAASLSVSQVTLVPGLLTSGRAKHWVPPAHWVMEN